MNENTQNQAGESEAKPAKKRISKKEALLAKKQQIDNQLKDIVAAENATKRKEDNRKKILIGAAILNSIKEGKYTEEKLASLMSGYLTKKADRKLFGLSEKSEEQMS